MKNGQVCLGPYTSESPTLGGNGPVWIDNSKTKHVAVITNCGLPHTPPSDDAILLHEELYCSGGTCDIRWYDCPSQNGRIYTLFISGCEVIITSFENGLLAINECDASNYGSAHFCFGKIYSNKSEYTTSNVCHTSFIFDNHHFSVIGQASQDFGLFDCGSCWEDESFSLFGVPDTQDPPEPPPEATDVINNDDDDDNQLVNVINEEIRSIWHNQPTGDDGTGIDTHCNVEENIPKTEMCSSQNNPSIAILRSGQSVIVYEHRDEKGLSKISLALFKSSVGNSIKYHRSLSKGILVNNPELSEGQFKFYDDILIDEDGDEITDENLKIGFITGPLRGGQPFNVTSVSRNELETGRVEYVMTFNLGGRIPNFQNSNNVSDIEWFLIRDIDIFPLSSLTLPDHLGPNGLPTAVANPCIAVAENNLGRNSDQSIFVAYQAFEDNRWNIYTRHIMISDKNTEAPLYQDNYSFDGPTFISTPVEEDFSQLEYHVVDITAPAGIFCALFEVRIPSTNEHLLNGGTIGSGITTSCGQEYNPQHVYIEATFDTNTCGLGVPNWMPGSIFTGNIPPTPSQLGWTGTPSCISIDRYPDNTSDWLYNKTICNQISLFDDPYCPSPYITLTYKPEELYNLIVGDDVITRVLYNLDANIPTSESGSSTNEVVDFMFVIDHSSSMIEEIDAVRQGVASFAYNLSEIGANFRFGFTIYARGDVTGGPNGASAVNPINCGGDTAPCALPAWMFDALDFPGSDAYGGFTTNVNTLNTALSGWGIQGAPARPFIAIQFALLDDRFQWRSNAKKFVLLITDALKECPGSPACTGYEPDRDTTISVANSEKATVICAVKSTQQDYIDLYLPLTEQTGWTEGLFPVRGTINDDGIYTYETTLGIIASTLSKSFTVGLSVIERNNNGYNPTFLQRSKVLITYDKDLTDLWTQEKNDLRFTDNIPVLIGATKGLSDFPFDLYTGSIYGIDPVHLIGNLDNWVYFSEPGQLKLKFPRLGIPPSGISQPILISTNSIRPKIAVNNRNDVFVAYESFEFGNSQIHIKGTGDFAQSSITGAKGSRITRFLSDNDFVFQYSITLPQEGVNQICDIVVDRNDIVHVTWQSNRDKYWEIYYANGLNLFEPVRVTQVKSRSSAPRIDVDKNGSIFVVYHDNRFGPFDIMMSHKEEKRILPLLQQDPYLASMAANYRHFTNLIPITINNTGSMLPLPGVLVGTKTEEGTGNDQENFIFRIENGEPLPGGNTDPWSIRAIASSPNGFLYGITEADSYGISTLLQLDAPEPEDPYIDIEISEIQPLGTLNLGNSVVIDMTHDYQDRLWILVVHVENNMPDTMSIINISTEDADLISETTIFNNVDQIKGAIASKSDGTFWVATYQDGQVNIYKSEYPIISGSISTFDFDFISNSILNPIAFTTDENDILFALEGLDVYIIDVNGSASLQFTINNGSSTDNPYLGPFPIGEISGFAYQFSGQNTIVGTGGYFNVIIEFYDNINLEGDPTVIIDSRTNLDAFLSPQNLDNDPYLEDAYFISANGIYLESGQSKIVVFDASLSRPDTSRLAYPYGFATNQTYFPKVFKIDPNNNITETKSIQDRSFSCNRCTQINVNNPDIYACSYSFVVSNPVDVSRTFNFQVDFFANQAKQSIIRRFNLIPGSPDLQYTEVNNKPAIDIWGVTGLTIKPGDAKLIQIYPSLSETEFICGINYFVRIQFCDNPGHIICSDFTKFENAPWNDFNVNSTSYSNQHVDMVQLGDKLGLTWVDDNGNCQFTFFGSGVIEFVAAFARSPSMHVINGKIGIAVNVSNSLQYLERQSQNNWTSKVIENNAGGSSSGQQILRENSNNRPAVAYYKSISSDLKYAEFNGTTWDIEIIDPFVASFAGLLHSIIDDITYVVQSKSYYRRVNGVWDQSSLPISDFIPLPHSILEVEEKLFIVGTQLNKLIWATSTKGDGLTWMVGGTIYTLTGNENFNASNLTIIKGKPNFAYTIDNLDGTYDIKITRLVSNTLSENIWETITVAFNLTIQDLSITSVVAISPFKGGAVFHGNTPLTLYLDQSLEAISINSDNFFCECSSTIRDNPTKYLGNIGRWISSGQGYSDTRVTDSIGNSMRPTIKTRHTDGAIILFEDYNEDMTKILGASFNESNVDQVFGTGTNSWFDYDLNISGVSVDVDVDFYDRSMATYEVQDIVSGKNLSKEEVPVSQIHFKSCDFDHPTTDNIISPDQMCNFNELEEIVVARDEFLEPQLIQKAIVHPNSVKYFTYNAAGKLTSVVSECEIKLQIWLRPEIIAIRLRNENTVFSDWCPVTPEINEYYIEKKWRLSTGSGSKEVCIQAMTYSGTTVQFCIPVIADYKKSVFELNIYSDNQYSQKIPLYDGVFVASTKLETSSIKAKQTETFYIEIVPNVDIDQNRINFDVLQQGANDQFDLPADKTNDLNGRTVFRGPITIYREDKVFNIDGLARIRTKIPGACDNNDFVAAANQFIKDQFNIVSINSESEDVNDLLLQYRQSITGKIGVNVILRPSEDPYFIFGDPNYYLKDTPPTSEHTIEG